MAVRSTKMPAAPGQGGPADGASDPAPALVPHGAHAGKAALPLHRPLILIGSRQRAHVHLISNSVSRVHSVIINTDHGSYLRDLASRTGTIVNGRHVREAGLRHSDTIQVGNFQFKFSDPTGRGPLAAGTRAPEAVLHVQGRDTPLAIDGRTVLIGQRDTCDVALRSAAVSTAHAIVFELNGRHFLRDLGSRTGTFINGRQIHQEALEIGDMVRIGETAIRYASAAPAEAVDIGEMEKPAVAEEPAEAAPTPVTSVSVMADLPVEPAEPAATDEFPDLAFAAEKAEPALPMATPEPEAPPAVSATTHEAVGVEPIPLAGTEEPAATAADLFESGRGPSDADTDLRAAAAEPSFPASENTPIPLADSEPAIADAEALAPLPSDDGSTLDPEIDFPSEPEAVASLVTEPFGPLTDLDLLKDADETPPTESRPSLLDDIDLGPETMELPAPAEPVADVPAPAAAPPTADVADEIPDAIPDAVAAGDAPAWSTTETVAPFAPVNPELTAEPPPGPATLEPPPEVSATAPADVNLGAIAEPPPEAVAPAAPVEEGPARPAKKRGRRSTQTTEAVAAEPKKRRLWGKKGKEAAEAEAAAATAEAAAAVPVAEEPVAPPASVADVVEDVVAAQPAPPTEAVPPPPDDAPAVSEGETLARTEPSPESALQLGLPDVEAETVVAGAGLADDVSMTSSEAPPADPAFDAMLEEFAGPSTGAIVEQTDAKPAEPEPDFEPDLSALEAILPPADPPPPEHHPMPPMPLGGVPAPRPEDLEALLANPLDFAPSPPVDERPRDLEAPARQERDAAPVDELSAFQDELAALREDPKAPEPEPAPREEAPASPTFDPFRGMGRDMGSFIGGLPLNLVAGDPFGAPPPPPLVPPSEPEATAFAAPVPDAPRVERRRMEPEPSFELPGPKIEEPLSPVADATAPIDALDPIFDPLSPVSPANEVMAPPTTSEGSDLDLSLPELEMPEGPPTMGATTMPGLLDPISLDLPELDEPPPPPMKPAGKGEDEIDPLLFGEAEAPTLQLLPKPQAPPPAKGPARGHGASKYPPTPPPPARVTRARRPAPRAPFDVDPASDIPDLGVPAVGPGNPPGLVGAPPSGKQGTTAHAFDGLALGRVREADVFSGLPLGADDPVLSGSRAGGLHAPLKRPRRAGGGTPPPEIPPDDMLGAKPGGDSGMLAPLAPLPPIAKRGGRVAPARDDATVAADTHRDGWGDGARGHAAPGDSPRRKMGVGVWLVLMFITLGATSAGILFFGKRPPVEVIGSLQFERLRDMSELQRKQFEQEQREWLARPDFRGQAREILLVSHAGVSPGFLGEDTEGIAAYDKIVRGAHVKERSGSLTLPYRGVDSAGDRARMESLIKALHARNKTSGDVAALLQSQFNTAQKELASLADQIEKAKSKANQLRGKAESVPDLEKKLRDAQAEDARLRTEAAEARREVDRLRAALDQAGKGAPARDADAPADGDAAPASDAKGITVSLISTAARVEADTQLREWAEELERLRASLAAANAQQSAALTSSTGSLDAALEQFRLALKRRLARNAEPQLREVWSADAELGRMERDLALKQRHRNAAAGGGLRQDVARLDAEVAALSRQVEARREALVGDSAYSRNVKELDKLVAESRSRSGAERVSGDEQMMARLAQIVSDARGDDGADDKVGADAELEKRARELKAASKAYAAAVAPATNAADGSAALEKRATELAARIASRRVVLAAAAEDERAAAVQKLRADLTAAQQREAAAVAAADRSAESVRQLKAELADARQSASTVEQAMRQWSGLESRQKQQQARIEDLRKQLGQTVVPVEPGADAVSVAPAGEDRRYLYMLFAGAAVVVGFSVMMYLSAQGGAGPAIPDRPNPFDAPIVGATPPHGAEADADDERPVAV